MAELVYPPVIGAVKTFWKVLNLQFDFHGQENLPDRNHGGAILAMNHISDLDFALVGTAALPMKRYVRFMAKKEIFNNKLAGPLMRGMHHISVDRSNGSASFVAAMRALRDGEIIGIFPEGTISVSFEIKELKSGAVRLAQGAGVPVIPTRRESGICASGAFRSLSLSVSRSTSIKRAMWRRVRRSCVRRW
jgi:1-acyl-sn-glycerol-3-phosphate acyltransferase